MQRFFTGIVLLITMGIGAQEEVDSTALKQAQLEKRRELEQRIYEEELQQKAYDDRYYQMLKKSVQQLERQESQAYDSLVQFAPMQGEGESAYNLEKYIEVTSVMYDVEFEDHIEDRPRIKGPSQYDSRIEPTQLNAGVAWQHEILLRSESIGMLIEVENLQQVSKTVYKLDISQSLGEKLNLCKDEAFYSQPSIGVGTAFIFDQKSMLTALHVLERPLKFYVVVFNYKIISKNGVVNAFVAEDDIYYPQQIIRKNDEVDIVEFSVDRNFNRPVLQWANSKNIDEENSEVYTIGFPSGLPMKIALNASILENDHPFYYYTSLDSFQGNSGSPVFHFNTHKVIGVLVSGELDYRFNGNCNESPVCSYPYCKGEKVIRIEEILNNL